MPGLQLTFRSPFLISKWTPFLIDLHDFLVSKHVIKMPAKSRFNKIATQGAPQMAVDKEANSLSRVYSYYSKFNLRLFYV